MTLFNSQTANVLCNGKKKTLYLLYLRLSMAALLVPACTGICAIHVYRYVLCECLSTAADQPNSQVGARVPTYSYVILHRQRLKPHYSKMHFGQSACLMNVRNVIAHCDFNVLLV